MRLFTSARCAVLATAFPLFVFAQADIPKKDPPKVIRDTATLPPGHIGKQGEVFKPYTDFVNARTVTQKGLFIIHKSEEKWFLEINDSIFSRDILVVTRLSKAGADMRNQMLGYAGDQINESVIRFDRGPNNKVFLRKVSYTEYSKDSSQSLYQAVMNSNIQPIVAAFDIKTVNPLSEAVVLDWTDWLNGDNDILFFEPAAKKILQLGPFQPDKSYVTRVASYPLNLEIRTVKTYFRSAPPTLATAAVSGMSTLEINTSIVMLPEKIMHPRFADGRIGYFTVGYTDFDKNEQGIRRISMIKRWRLVPRPEDEEKYRRGQMVEPLRPIIFYIDPATPKKWVPYLMQGVDDWQQTFEKAGFKNAIFAKRAPTWKEDSTWSIEDARYSAIVYKPSVVPNASGPSIADPRSGEILESHVNWYHNVMSLLHNWYFIQAGAIDPRARSIQLPDSLMGQLIRFACSHEIGHALGLLHNFGSSSTVPVEKLRDKKWLAVNGHTPSIMDYARFNYVAQQEDSITVSGILPRIGDYDNWAIEWGYRIFMDTTSGGNEAAILNKLTVGKLKNRRLWFGAENNPEDPRSQNEDLGDDAMKAGTYGIRNLKRIVPHLAEWTSIPTENFDDLQEMYNEVLSQFMRYMGHAAKNIGGTYETRKTSDQPGDVYEYVPAATQKRALRFISDNLFTTPYWLIDKNMYFKFGSNPVSYIGSRQDAILSSLLSTARLDKLINGGFSQSSPAYPLSAYMADLQKEIWREVDAGKPIDIYRRNLQKSFLEKIGVLIEPAASGNGFAVARNTAATNDVISVVKYDLKLLQKKIAARLPAVTDTMTMMHLQDCIDRISRLLKPKS